MNTRLFAALFAASTLIAAPALAADTYTMDPQHTWVQFTIQHGPWAKAIGVFHEVSADLTFDQTDVGNSAVSAEIAANSIDTNFADRDRDLLGPDFLNADEFPTITFKSTAIEKTGDKTGQMTGDLTIVGVTRPVTLAVVFNAETPLPWDQSKFKAGFSATGSFQPGDFGIEKIAAFGLGPDLDIHIEAEAFKN